LRGFYRISAEAIFFLRGSSLFSDGAAFLGRQYIEKPKLRIVAELNGLGKTSAANKILEHVRRRVTNTSIHNSTLSAGFVRLQKIKQK
jgi:hypothetical protein